MPNAVAGNGASLTAAAETGAHRPPNTSNPPGIKKEYLEILPKGGLEKLHNDAAVAASDSSGEKPPAVAAVGRRSLENSFYQGPKNEKLPTNYLSIIPKGGIAAVLKAVSTSSDEGDKKRKIEDTTAKEGDDDKPKSKKARINQGQSGLFMLARLLALSSSSPGSRKATKLSKKAPALPTSMHLKKSAPKRYNGPPRQLRICLKEGCDKVLTGKQRKRCDGHHMLCIRLNCSKFVQDHDTGLCINHGAVKCQVADAPKKVRICLKEGCGAPLKGQQRTRCKEHHWQCIKQDCTKNEQSNYGGFCKYHAPFKPASIRKCMKDGCNTDLRNPNHKRCSLHKNMCLYGNCIKHQQSNCGGYCREHASDEDRSRALKVDRDKKKRHEAETVCNS